MSVPLSRMLTLALAVLVLGAATTASARPKKPRAERTATPITTCDGTPIIMQGIDCKQGPTGGEQQATTPAQRPRVTARGSGGSYAPARLSTPSLPLSQLSEGVYIPPPARQPPGPDQ